MSRLMKDSGVPWIGRMPCEWNIIRIKNTSWLKGRIGWDGLKSNEFMEEGPYLITGTDFQDGYINWNSCVHISQERFDEDELLHIFEGDLLITKDGTIGKVAVVKDCPKKVSLNSGVMIIRNNNSDWMYDNKYMYYVLNSEEFNTWFSLCQKPNSTILHLYQHQFSDFQYTFPPLSEQSAIVSFLDENCTKIDEAINRHKQIIEKLEEYRKSVITAAVTKGLDSNAKMKDGVVRWAKSIPSHWSVKKLKFVADITNGSDPKTEGTTPVYGSGSSSFKTCGEYKKGPAVLIGRKGATLHIPHYIDHNYWNVDTAFDCKTTGGNNIKWFYYIATCLDYKYYITQTTLPSMTQTDYENMSIPVPPVSEQADIVQFLDTKIVALEESVSQHKSAIAKLEEYRKSLIYNAVTGKIDCRNGAEQEA